MEDQSYKAKIQAEKIDKMLKEKKAEEKKREQALANHQARTT